MATDRDDQVIAGRDQDSEDERDACGPVTPQDGQHGPADYQD